MKLYENCIELSDKRVIWEIYNSKLNEEEFWEVYDLLLKEALDEFEHIYKCEVYMLGRSGRHICVENTAQNRMSYYRMVKSVERLQKWFINSVNKNCN